MNDEFNQKISQFIDGNLEHDEAISLLQEMVQKPELVDKLNRYQAIGQSLKHNVFLDVSSGFSERVRQQIINEPAIFAPQPKRQLFLPYQKPLALAASIAMIAVLAHEKFQHTPAPLQAPASQLSIAASQTHQDQATAKTERQPPLNARIHQYLQAHNSSIYSHDEAELKPPAQVASYK